MTGRIISQQIIEKFSNLPGFNPNSFLIQYEDQDVDEFVDLDSMEQLNCRK